MSANPNSVMNALTIDVEDYFHGQAFRHLTDRDWDGMEDRVVANTRRFLSIFAQAGVKATFFVLGWVARKHPALVDEIHRQGHEVATHGYWHKPIFNQSEAEFRKDLQQAKAAIEDVIGEEIIGHRAATFSIVQETLWAIEVIQELGFLYDSSVFPIHHDTYGISNAPRYPYRLREELWEFPLSTIAVGGFRLPVAGGGYFRLYPYLFTKWSILQINEQGYPVICYLHPHEIDPDPPQPRSMSRRIRRRLCVGKTEDKLERLLSDFEFGPVREVLNL